MYVRLGRAVPAVRARGVEERRARPGAGAVTESNAPDAGCLHRQPATERPPTLCSCVRVDRTGSEVRDEQVAAEAAEAARCERDTPRLVELLLVADARDAPPVQVRPGRR